LYYLGPYQITQAKQLANQQLAKKYVRQAYRVEMQRRVNDIQNIKKLIERITKQQSLEKSLLASKNSSVDKAAKNEMSQKITAKKSAKLMQAELPKPVPDPISQLYEKSQTLIAEISNIKQVKQLQQAEKLAELLDIPLEEAQQTIAKKTIDEHVQTSKTLNKLISKSVSLQEMQQVVAKNHEQAKKILLSLSAQLQTQQFGHSVELENSSSTVNGAVNKNNLRDQELMAQIQQQLKHGFTRGSSANNTNIINRGSNSQYRKYSQLNPTVNSPLKAENFLFPVLGRMIKSGGQKADKLYVDTWYMVGPFENRGSDYRDVFNPPEILVDLNALYPGKDNKIIAWQFYQTSNYPTVPDNAEGDATYYGYTELYFEQETTLWVGLGCDDDCKLWFNQELVWRSGAQFKPWYNNGGFSRLYTKIAQWDLIENYRRITFKKGVNKLLFRLDNGYADLFFAMVIMRNPS